MHSPQGRGQLYQPRAVGQARREGPPPVAGATGEAKLRGAADIDRDARAASEILRNMLINQPPLNRDIEFESQKARNFYLTLIFSHPLSTYAQSLDGLWHHSSYTLIASFRQLISQTEASLPPQPISRKAPHNSAAHIELRKVLTRFRQALASEEGFYRGLVSRIVAFYQLQSLARDYLASVGVQVQDRVGVEGVVDQGQGLAPALGVEEKREKLGLVYKGFICLGDLERYKEQYSEKARREREREGGSGRAGSGEEKFVRAKMYYEVARGIQPDDGSAFNQLAVISTYVGDDLLCVYYYIRALAVRQAFKNIDEILEKFLRKVYERWHAAREEGTLRKEVEGDDSEGLLEEFKRGYLVVISILFRRAGTSHLPELRAASLARFADLLRSRTLPSETIVKLTVITIGSHWHARQSPLIVPAESDVKRVKRRQDSEEIALESMLSFFGVLVRSAADELEDLPSQNPLYEVELHLQISAVLRRLLPAIRIMSKWVKLHLEYISRYASTPNQALATEIQAFWTQYRRLINSFVLLFPIAQLPTLSTPLEEDTDMQGFVPLTRSSSTRQDRDNQANGHGEAPHPNEEQLMRIADLQVDAKLLMQSQAGLKAMSGNGSAIMSGPPQTASHLITPREADDGDIASVSTETEDDPVNLAMRATLGGGSIDGEEGTHMDEEEVIVWGKGSQTPVNVTPGAIAAKPPTAFDLLQNLMLDTGTTSPAARTVPPGQSSPRTSLLFGGEPGGSNIWTMTREESEKGTQRAVRGSAGNLAAVKNIWNDAASSPPPGQVPAVTPVPQTPSPYAAYQTGEIAMGNIPSNANAAWSSRDGVEAYQRPEAYQQYYEPQRSPYGAQWAQSYHPS